MGWWADRRERTAAKRAQREADEKARQMAAFESGGGGLSEETHRLVDSDLKHSEETHRLVDSDGKLSEETYRSASKD